MNKVAKYCLAVMLFLGFCFGGVLSWHYLVSDLKTAAGVMIMVWAGGGVVWAVLSIWVYSSIESSAVPVVEGRLKTDYKVLPSPEEVSDAISKHDSRHPDALRSLRTSHRWR